MKDTPLECAVNVRADLLMCRPHWWQVSKPTRDLVYFTLAGEGPLGKGYRDAVAQAVSEVLARNGITAG